MHELRQHGHNGVSRHAHHRSQVRAHTRKMLLGYAPASVGEVSAMRAKRSSRARYYKAPQLLQRLQQCVTLDGQRVLSRAHTSPYLKARDEGNNTQSATQSGVRLCTSCLAISTAHSDSTRKLQLARHIENQEIKPGSILQGSSTTDHKLTMP